MVRKAFQGSKGRVVLAAISAALLAGCGQESPDALVTSAKTYIARNDVQGAVIQLKNALQQNAEHPEARFLMGTTALKAGDAVSAEVELRRALKLGYPADEVIPPLARAMLLRNKTSEVLAEFSGQKLSSPRAGAALKTALASAYASQQKFDQATAAAGEAAALDATYVPAQVLQARLAVALGRVDDGLAALDQIVAAHPGEADAWHARGDVLWHRRKGATEALAAYRKAIEIDPTHAAARSAEISLLFELGDGKAAQERMAELRKLPGQQMQVAFFDAQSALAAGQRDRAYELIQQVLKVAPLHPLALQVAGSIELSTGRLLAAERTLAKAVQAGPELPSPRRLLAQTHLRAGEPDKALAVLRPLLASTDHPDPQALALAGEAYLQRGDLANAERAFHTALEADPASSQSRTAVALLQMRKGDTAKGLQALTAIADEDKKGIQADLALVSYYLERGDHAKTLAAVDRLAAKQPDKPLPVQLRALSLLAQGQRAQARAAFERALSIDPVFVPAVAQLVSLDIAERRFTEARARLEKLLAADPGNLQAMLGIAGLMVRAQEPAAQIEAWLRKAVELNPTDVRARIVLVDHLLSRQQVQPALEAAQAGVAAQPESVELLDALGRAQTAAGERNQAVATFNKLIGLAPKSPQPHVRLAALAMMDNDRAASRASLERALQVAPALLAAQESLINLDLGESRFDHALRIARDIQQQRPRELTGHLWEADIRARQSGESAVEVYRKLFAKAPATETATRLYMALVDAGQRKEAAAVAAAWLQSHPKDFAFRIQLGESLLRSDDYAGAAVQFQAVLAEDGEHVGALNNLAWALVKQGSPSAVSYANKAVALRPDTPTLLDTLSSALAVDGQLPKAIETQKKAIALARGEPSLRLGLARLYIQAGDNAAAKNELNALASLGDKFPQQAEIRKLLAPL
ncbi:XrtA/PEP-CTERM system TPR-repeat protein PrsT [Aquincola sp. MAHUQ-54]|uniref:XrtA/PEP-CTERM system TPR-repeat protein PrsT n=1 Tax=Aquincola agrisoli TaxID=3119538 RepID=A0AAW9QHM4_9BURK